MRSDSPGGKNLGPRTDQAPVSFMPLLNAVGEIFFKIFILNLLDFIESATFMVVSQSF